jgi:hypothetical protein
MGDIPAATQATTAITSTPDIITGTGEGWMGLGYDRSLADRFYRGNDSR